MRAKSMVLITIALGCGLVASIGISQVIKSDGSGKAVETADVYVAMTDVNINDILNAENVKLEAWPVDKVPEGTITTLEDVDGKYARVRLYPGEPIIRKKISDQLIGPAITIPNGYRAVSAKVTMDSAVSNLIRPGDEVDLHAFMRRSSEVPQTAVRTILRNVRIFAVNSETEISTDEAGKTIVAKTVSVLVKDAEVGALMLALELGKLRLSLRRPNEEDGESVVESTTVDDLLGRKQKQITDGSSDNSQSGRGLLDFLANSAANRAPADTTFAAPGKTMEIITPNGVDVYQLSSSGERPQQISFGGSRAFVNTSTPGDAPLGDQPLGATAGDDGDEGESEGEGAESEGKGESAAEAS